MKNQKRMNSSKPQSGQEGFDWEAVKNKVDSYDREIFDMLSASEIHKASVNSYQSTHNGKNKKGITHHLDRYSFYLEQTKDYEIEFSWVACHECRQTIKRSVVAFNNILRLAYEKCL